MTRPLGLWIGQWIKPAPEAVRLVRPSHVVLAENAWASAAEIVQMVPDVKIVFRDTYDRFGLDDNKVNDEIRKRPVAFAEEIASFMVNATAPYRIPLERMGVECYLHSFNEPAVETLAQCDALSAAEVRFGESCHNQGAKVVLLNFGAGRPGNMDYLRYFEGIEYFADAFGFHLYSLKGEDDDWTALRYRKYPDYLRTRPLISTEAGIDQEGRGGWQRQGFSEKEVIAKMKYLMAEWAKDGVMAPWFCATAVNDKWEELGFYGTPLIYNTLGTYNRIAEEDTPVEEPPDIIPPEGGEGEEDVAYAIGPGVEAKLLQVDDVAVSAEEWIGGVYSITAAEKGLVIYHKEANKTYYLPENRPLA
jgi:hypothetical protein